MRDPKFVIGMIFPTCDMLKRAIKAYAILSHKEVKLVKNDKARVRTKCVEGCPWTVFTLAESDGLSFKVKTINEEHKCGLSFAKKGLSS